LAHDDAASEPPLSGTHNTGWDGTEGEDRFAELPPAELDAPPVVLRRYWGRELPALLQAVNDSLGHLRPWMPWAAADPLEPALAEFVSHAVEQFDRAENFNYCIWDDRFSALVGGAGLHPRLGRGRIEIGYWVRSGWLHRGIGSAAARALTSAAFGLTGIEEVHIHCDVANIASAAVPRRLGFRLVRTVDDGIDAPGEIGRSMQWVVTRVNWAPQQPPEGPAWAGTEIG
jgi:RimJ/RimL family protein N-acetyltransferase